MVDQEGIDCSFDQRPTNLGADNHAGFDATEFDHIGQQEQSIKNAEACIGHVKEATAWMEDQAAA